jgi:hypothetical protein
VHCCLHLDFNALVRTAILKMAWTPVSILPNLRAANPIDGEVIAFAGVNDPRVQAICAASPKFASLLSRFTDAFHVRLEPVVLIARDDTIGRLSGEAFLSFRDFGCDQYYSHRSRT